MTDFLFDVIATELEDAVGKENCSTRTIDKLTHSVDYFWLSRMWADRGLRMPEGDFIVAPKDAKETSAVLKIANYYKIPVTTWGAGGGTQGGAIPVCGGIVLDTKRMNKIYDVTGNVHRMRHQCNLQAHRMGSKRERLRNNALSLFTDLFNCRRLPCTQRYRCIVNQVW